MLRPIAIYLPQYHPIPENDEWWGKGFTEWTNVVRAKPLFKGHYQPHLPADLGFYDLRLEEIRKAQAELAKQNGIHGFCYYHYWFNGRRILERPFHEVFESGNPDFSFMLCWANENWTRVWDGGENEILLKQNYHEEDDRAHIRSLIPYFKDKRYIKVDGKPVFVIYKSSDLPNIKQTLLIWRQEAKREGMELYVCRMERGNEPDNKEDLMNGFDAAIDFQPGSSSLKSYREKNKKKYDSSFLSRVKKKIDFVLRDKVNKIDLEDFVQFDLLSKDKPYKFYPGVSPMWDNTARRGALATVFTNSSPELYGKWLSGKLNKFKPYSQDENFIFINAWNEWAEGNHLEPCKEWGHQYLETTKKVLNQFK